MSSELFAGVTKCSLKAIRIAVEAGARIDAVTEPDGYTALHLLCRSQSGRMSPNEVAAALWLLERGADVHCTSKHLETPLHLAVSSRSHTMIDALIARGAKVTRDRWGNTPLHCCLRTTDQDPWVWERMIALGCGLDDANDAGETPLLCAQLTWNDRAVKYLVDKGASRTIRDAQGRTALDRARELQQDKIIPLLA